MDQDSTGLASTKAGSFPAITFCDAFVVFVVYCHHLNVNNIGDNFRMSKVTKQDQVNNANSAFILINCLISQGCQSGSISQVQVVQVVRVVRGSFGQVFRGSGGQVFRCSVVRW